MAIIGEDVESGLNTAFNQEIPTTSPLLGQRQPQLSCFGHACPIMIVELWRRVRMEVIVELPMLKQRWKLILFGVIMQYVHGIFTQLAHRLHEPQEEPLPDLGFELTPELGPEKHWVSETIFGTLFITFIIWTFTPFFTQHKRFYTVVMWSRLLMVLVVCQALRIITFSVTRLPGPSFHCRGGEPFATRPWPDHWTGHVVVDVQRAASKSCGDLIFSSHTTFMLTGILAYNEYGNLPIMRTIAWLAGVVVSILIIASRKHYTVDIVVAWYAVPLVFYTLHRRWTTKRPMSELLVALGENDEPDPGQAENGMDTTHTQDQVAVQMLALRNGDKHNNALLSHPKERAASTAKLNIVADAGVEEGHKGGGSATGMTGNGGRTRPLQTKSEDEANDSGSNSGPHTSHCRTS